MAEARYTYGRWRTLERAELALEDAYATAEILPGEFPEIEPVRNWTGRTTHYEITLRG